MSKKWIIALAVLAAFTLTLSAFQEIFAEEKTVKVRIPQCTCDDTDMKVRFTLQRVEGIKKVESNPEAQNAIIVFDDSKINFEKIRDLLQQERVTILGKPEYLK